MAPLRAVDAAVATPIAHWWSDDLRHAWRCAEVVERLGRHDVLATDCYGFARTTTDGAIIPWTLHPDGAPRMPSQLLETVPVNIDELGVAQATQDADDAQDPEFRGRVALAEQVLFNTLVLAMEAHESMTLELSWRVVRALRAAGYGAVHTQRGGTHNEVSVSHPRVEAEMQAWWRGLTVRAGNDSVVLAR
jgi:hypothetical protein